jgi:hypothetical protein
MESGILRREASSLSKAAAGWGTGFMIHNSDRLWLSISVVWAALLLAVLLVGSLFFITSN